jgi:uncharacterized Zn-binding protein involved in type VI secretion
VTDKDPKDPKDSNASKDSAWPELPGAKTGKWAAKAPSGKAEKEYKKEGPQKKVEWGDRKPKPEDPNNPKPADANKPKGGGKSSAEISAKALYTKTYADMVWTTTREGDEDKTYYEAMSFKADGEALAASFDAKELQGKVTAFKAKAEFKAAHGQIDLVEVISDFLFGKPAPPGPLPSAPMTPMAARVMDLTTHGAPCMPGPGSTNVFIGGMPALRATLDQMVCTAPGAGSHGGGPFMLGEPTVLINNMPAIRVGDFVTEPNGGPNVIVVGCPTVMIGMPAPVPDVPPPKKNEDELPWVLFESVAKGDVGAAEAEAKLDGKYDLKKGQLSGAFKLGASAAAAKAELPLKVRLRIPFTSAYLGLGVTAAGTLGSVGAEVQGSLKVNETDQETGKTVWFGTSGGGGAHLGVGGASVKFSLDISSK